MTPACSRPAAGLAGVARPVRPVPSKTLLSPVLGTPQSSSLQPCVPRPGPSLTLDPDWLGPIQTRRIVTNRSQETSEGVNKILRTVFTSRSRRLLNGFGQWEGSRHGLSQPRPGPGISGNTNVKLQLPHFSWYTFTETRHSQSLAWPVWGKVLLSCEKVILCKLPGNRKSSED